MRLIVAEGSDMAEREQHYALFEGVAADRRQQWPEPTLRWESLSVDAVFLGDRA